MLVYNDYFLGQAIRLYDKKTALSIVDCYAATEPKVYGNTLLTFNNGLVRHGGDRVVEPYSLTPRNRSFSYIRRKLANTRFRLRFK